MVKPSSSIAVVLHIDSDRHAVVAAEQLNEFQKGTLVAQRRTGLKQAMDPTRTLLGGQLLHPPLGRQCGVVSILDLRVSQPTPERLLDSSCL